MNKHVSSSDNIITPPHQVSLTENSAEDAPVPRDLYTATAVDDSSEDFDDELLRYVKECVQQDMH